MNVFYILDKNGNPKIESDLVAWSAWFNGPERMVKKEQVNSEALVSTVFLGVDHSFDGGSPILWETMVFGGPMDQSCTRCGGSLEQAEAMHESMVAMVKEVQP